MHRTLLAALLMTASSVAHAAGQPPTRVSVSFGVGGTVGIATDDSAVKPIYAGSIRYDVRSHLAVEGEVAHCGRVRSYQP